MILNRRLLFALLLLLTSCSANNVKTSTNNPNTVNQTRKPVSPSTKTPYMPTGFYYLADSLDGVKMRKRGSNEIYTIAADAFASVKNIESAKIKKTYTDSGVYAEIRIEFDSKGTNDLAKGTGNVRHPKIAVVIANRLLYVVDNAYKMTAGVINVYLEGYTDPELKALQDEIDHKR